MEDLGVVLRRQDDLPRHLVWFRKPISHAAEIRASSGHTGNAPRKQNDDHVRKNVENTNQVDNQTPKC
jgi:hypothetical protein